MTYNVWGNVCTGIKMDYSIYKNLQLEMFPTKARGDGAQRCWGKMGWGHQICVVIAEETKKGKRAMEMPT